MLDILTKSLNLLKLQGGIKNMKVEDLIKRLSTYDKSLEVVMFDPEYYYCRHICEITLDVCIVAEDRWDDEKAKQRVILNWN